MSNAMERKAQAAWEACGRDPLVVRELVALGFEDPIDETITWWELENVAVAGEFRVEPEELERVIRLAASEGLVDPAGERYLWHSHYLSDQPSESDMSNFPGWLVDAGVVYHVPSGVSRVYNAGGIIPEAQNADSPRDTLVGRDG